MKVNREEKDMTSLISLFISFFLLLSFGNAAAGPFGLDMGMSLKDIGAEPEKVAHGKYKIINPPKSHSAFESYVVELAPKTGLCFIKAVGKDIRTSSYGLELQSAFNEMKGKLSEAYGESETTDMLFPGSIWDEPDDWMMGLIKKERHLMAIWDQEHGSSLPPDISSIGLAARPSSGDKGYLVVEYYFTNEPLCVAELAAQEDHAL